MQAKVEVGGRFDPGRDTRNWVGRLTVKADREGDQFILAAIARALFSQRAKGLKTALVKEAHRCHQDHLAAMKRAKATKGKKRT